MIQKYSAQHNLSFSFLYSIINSTSFYLLSVSFPDNIPQVSTVLYSLDILIVRLLREGEISVNASF